MMNKNRKNYKSVEINLNEDTFTILNGTIGTYELKDIAKCDVLNEKANRKGKQEPFLALMPGRGLPTGIFSSPYLFVGIKITMKNGKKLAIYVSETKTQVGTDQYRENRKEAKEILKLLLPNKNPL